MQQQESNLNPKPRFQRISHILAEQFPGDAIHLTDESRKHAKHLSMMDKKGSAEGAEETHFHLEMTSRKFKNLSRVQQQRMIHDLLKTEFDTGLHSLKLSLKES